MIESEYSKGVENSIQKNQRNALLGGFFAISGTFGNYDFGIGKVPGIQFQEDDSYIASKLVELIGGVNVRANNIVRINTKKAKNLVRDIIGYMPGRREELNVFFEQEESMASALSYEELVLDPWYLTGVTLATNYFSGIQRGPYQHLTIASRNIELMDALYAAYGGNLRWHSDSINRKKPSKILDFSNASPILETILPVYSQLFS